MKIQEATKKWGVSEKTILNYILKGYIDGLSIENNEIVIPDTPKPYVQKKPRTVQQEYQYIKNAMNKKMYVNAKILGIEEKEFEELLKALIDDKSILPKTEGKLDYTSSMGYTLAPNSSRNIEVNVNSSIIDIKDNQFGLINGKVG